MTNIAQFKVKSGTTIIEGKLHLKVWGCLVDKHKNILMSWKG